MQVGGCFQYIYLVDLNKYKEKTAMKPFSGLSQQYSISKLQAHTPGYPSPLLPKSTSSRNFGKVAPSTPIRKKEPAKLRNATQLRERMSRSIEEIPHLESDEEVGPLFGVTRTGTAGKKARNGGKGEILIQNCQDNDNSNNTGSGSGQLFSESYQKLSKVYTNFQTYKNRNSIQEQLSQILALIREQRTAIKAKLQQIQMKKCKKQSSTTVQSGQNTQSIITTNPEISTAQAETQTEPMACCACSAPEQQIKGNQSYQKLIKILEDMNINSRQILPQDIKVNEEEVRKEDGQRKYQQLKDTEIITVQKFVIKKLVQKITGLEKQDHA